MKVYNNKIINTFNPDNVENNPELKLSSQAGNNKKLADSVKISISGKARSKKLTLPVAKKNTAGLVITDLETSEGDGLGGKITTETSIARVSNEKAAVGASENRLGHNTRNIDNPPKGLKDR